jgi:hypothetical protein
VALYVGVVGVLTVRLFHVPTPMNSLIGKYMQYDINIPYYYNFFEKKLAKHGVEIKTRMWTAWTRACASIPGKVKTHLSVAALRSAIGSTQPSSHCLPGALSPGLKRWRSSACQSFLFSTKIRNVWSCTSYPPHAFIKYHFVRQSLKIWAHNDN